MLRHYADFYIRLGAAFNDANRFFDGGLAGSILQITNFHASELANHLMQIHTHCQLIGLNVTQKLVISLFDRYSTSLPTYDIARQEFKQIEHVFRTELDGILFMSVLAHRSKFYSDELTVGEEISRVEKSLVNFRSAVTDLREAGRCFAMERFTACVYHLSRVVEFGLYSVGVYGEVSDALNWNKVLNECQSKLSKGEGKFAGISKHDTEYFSEVLGLLRNFKTAWRNPVSHIPEVFDEDKARNLFAITDATMTCISKRFSEVPRSPLTDKL